MFGFAELRSLMQINGPAAPRGNPRGAQFAIVLRWLWPAHPEMAFQPLFQGDRGPPNSSVGDPAAKRPFKVLAGGKASNHSPPLHRPFIFGNVRADLRRPRDLCAGRAFSPIGPD